jgi:hypothetical protein
MAFDKLYADLVAPDGSVYVLYLATLDFVGGRLRFAELEAYPARGQRQVYIARPSPTHRTTLERDEPLDVELSTSLGSFRFQALQVNGGYAPAGPPQSGLEWSVCMGRAEARLELPSALGGGLVTGTGYIDHLRVVRPSVHRTLRSLHWGRAHLAKSSIVWTRLGFSDGEAWEQFARWSFPGAEAEPGRLTRSDRVAGVQIEAAGGKVQSERVLHEGCALDRTRVPSAPVRWLLNAMAGRTHLQRRATRIVEADNQTTGWGIHESVSFPRCG